MGLKGEVVDITQNDLEKLIGLEPENKEFH
jgi:hypothetical protein